jgi:hypothetical protein
MNCSCLSRFAIGAMSLAVLPAAHSATFCVGTVGELQDALAIAESNGANDVIRIRTGTYTYIFPFVVTSFSYDTQEDFDITLQGGWTGLSGTCSRRVSNPESTVLVGSGETRVLSITGSNSSQGDIIVERLTVRDGAVNGDGAGMRLGGNYGSNGFSGDIVVENVYFDDNAAEAAAGLLISTNGGVRVRNSVFRSNSCETNACAASIYTFSFDSSQIRTVFSNNTIFGNVCTTPSATTCITGGVLIQGLGLMPRTAMFNNAFALNDGNDVELQSGSQVDVFYNNINMLAGTPASSFGNLNFINPGFISPILDDDFRLKPTSPLRNAGYDGFLIGLPPYSATDYAGTPRVQEGLIDIGAHEFSERIFEDGFDG